MKAVAFRSFRYRAFGLAFIMLACHSKETNILLTTEDDTLYKSYIAVGDSLAGIGLPDTALVYYIRALQIADSLGHVRHKIELAGVIGRSYLFELAEVNKAEEILLRQEGWIEEHPQLDPRVKVQNCLDLSSLYRRKSDLPQSHAYALVAYHLCNELGVQDSMLRSQIYTAIGSYHYQTKDSIEARRFFHKARSAAPKGEEASVRSLLWMVGLNNEFNNFGPPDSAKFWMTQYESFGEHHPHILADVHRLKAVYYLIQTSDMESVLAHSREAIRLYRQYNIADPVNLAFSYSIESTALQHLREYDAALQSIDSALLVYFGTVDNFEIYRKDSESIDLLASKAEILADKGMHMKDTATINLSLQLYRDIFVLLDHFTKWDTDGVIFNRIYNNFVYTKQIVLFTFLHQLTGNTVWLRHMHDIIAAYKGFVFGRERKWTFLQQDATQQNPAIQQILDNDFKLQATLFESGQKPFLEEIKDYPHILKLYKIKKALISKLEAEDLDGLASMRKPFRLPADSLLNFTLTHQAAVINYYVGDRYYNADSIYVLVAHNGQLRLFVQHYTASLSESIHLLDTFHLRHTLRMDGGVDSHYVQASMRIYDEILRPVLEALPDISSIILVPDEELHHVAFEGLMMDSKKPLSGLEWGDPAIRYLVDEVAVSYAYTTNQLQPMVAAERKYTIDMLGIAFTDIETLEESNLPGLPELVGGIQDMNVLADVFDKKKLKVFDGFDCTKENFFKHASRSRVMHISTHGRFDPEQRNSGTLFMRKGDGVEEIYQYEIRFANIHPELLVLSACESGAGELVIDEGMMSIGRIFQANGAGKVISARWPVSDRASTDFFHAFYTQYHHSGDIGLSFRSAQLALRQGKGRFAFPGHWSGFGMYL